MNQPWTITLLGLLRAEREGQTITRFRTQKTAALFAYLAFHHARSHGHEELSERFWPDSDPQVGSASLRTALASLRRQLEPPGTPRNSVLVADRLRVRLNPEAVTVDVARFDTPLEAPGSSVT